MEPILATVGWHHPVPTAPISLGEQGRCDRFTNVAGLIAGETTLGDELRQLVTEADILASALRTRVDHRWDGTAFVEM